MRALLAILLVVPLVLAAVPPAAAGADGPASLSVEPDAAEVDPLLLSAPPGPLEAIVSLSGPPDEATVRAVEEGAGAEVLWTFAVIDGLHVRVDRDRVGDLAQVDGVWRIDAVEPVTLWLDASRPAIRVGEPLWGQGIDGSGTTVAVVDTGIDASHPGMEGRVKHGVVFPAGGADPQETSSPTDLDGHGTHVAGIVGGTGAGSSTLGSDAYNYIGVARATSFISLDVSQAFNTANTARAFDWIHRNYEQYGITVVQNSWGRSNVDQPYDPDDPMIQATNTLVVDDGIAVIFAAANEGPGEATLSMEAENPNVLTVAAVDETGTVAEFSSRGPVYLEDGSVADWDKPDVSAPGVRVMSAASTQTSDGRSLDSPYKELSGTSMASPHVGGLAGMIKALNPDMHPFAVYDTIIGTAQDLGAPGHEITTGHGMVVADRAIQLALGSEGGEDRWTENYYKNGTLGPKNPVVDGDDAGAPPSVEETFPVKPFATQLTFELTWEGRDAEAPEMTVTLENPNGGTVQVDVQDGQATATVEEPKAGFWTWSLEPTPDVTTATVDYQMAAAVDVDATQADDFGPRGGGGSVEGVVRDLADRAVTFAKWAWANHRNAVLVVAGAFVLLLVARSVRKRRG